MRQNHLDRAVPKIILMSVLLVGTVSVFLSDWGVSPSHGAPGRRVALVVGNAAYRHTVPLDNPKNDAQDIGKALKRLGFEVEVETDLSRSDFEKVLRAFGDRVEGASAALFFYAGHGIQVDGTNYLVPIDARLRKKKHLKREAISLNGILEDMEGTSKVNLVLLDACRDNPLSRSLARSLRGTRSVVGMGLAPVDASTGTLISFATKDGATASDGRGRNSPYTKALLNHIEQSGVDVRLMLGDVGSTVEEATGGKQVPWTYGSLRGRFHLARGSIIEEEAAHLTVQTDPSDAKVRILNIQPKYQPGMLLDPGRYHLEVSKSGHKTVRRWIAMGHEDVDEYISLRGGIPPVSPVQSGSLYIKTAPSGADVYVDKTHRGQAPLEIKNITAGRVRVYAEKSGYQREEKSVRIRTGKQTRLTLLLSPQAGRLEITSQPSGAEWYLDGDYVGMTSGEIDDVNPGSYRIMIKKRGYEDWSGQVMVRTGKTARVSAPLQQRSKPKDCWSNQRQGKTCKESSTDMAFVWVPKGCFQMGMSDSERRKLQGHKEYDDWFKDAEHRHKVCVDGFWMGKNEVTVGQFRKFVNASGYETEAERGDGCKIL